MNSYYNYNVLHNCIHMYHYIYMHIVLYYMPLGQVVQRCADVMSWESKRRQVLKESFQPAVAYLMCDATWFHLPKSSESASGGGLLDPRTPT